MLENVAHFFHLIRYTLTCLVSEVAIVLAIVLSLGGLATAVCRLYWQEMAGCIVGYRL